VRIAAAALLLLTGFSAPGCGNTEVVPEAVHIGRDEPGDRFTFSGTVFDMDGRPLPSVAVVAYHADSAGRYNPPGAPTRVPRLRGVCETNDEGRFGFVTIRPGGYPNSDEPAHIHLIVAAPAHHVRHLEIWFEDDPRVGEAERRRAAENPSTLIVAPKRDSERAWSVGCEIRLDGN